MRVPHVLVLVPGLGSVRNHAHDRVRDRVRDLNHLVLLLLQTPQLRVQDEDRTVLLLVELVQIGYTDAGNIPVLRVVIGLFGYLRSCHLCEMGIRTNGPLLRFVVDDTHKAHAFQKGMMTVQMK